MVVLYVSVLPDELQQHITPSRLNRYPRTAIARHAAHRRPRRLPTTHQPPQPCLGSADQQPDLDAPQKSPQGSQPPAKLVGSFNTPWLVVFTGHKVQDDAPAWLW